MSSIWAHTKLNWDSGLVGVWDIQGNVEIEVSYHLFLSMVFYNTNVDFEIVK